MSSIIAAETPETPNLENEPGATTEPSETQTEKPEESAKGYQKLQSDYDTLKGQSETLKNDFDTYKQGMAPKEQFYSAFEKNPDWIPVVQKAIEGYQSGETEHEGFNPSEDFDPAEAYTPDTPSYKFRVSQEDARIKKAVDSVVGGIQQERLMDQTLGQLVQGGMSEENAVDYTKFLEHPEQYPGGKELLMGVMAKAFTQSKSGTKPEVENVIQESFPSAGSITGMVEAPASDTDLIMKNITDQGNKKSILLKPM